MHQHDVARGALLDEGHDAFGVRVRTEGQVPHLASNIEFGALVNVEGLAARSGEELVANGAGHAVAREDDHVELRCGPVLEHLKGRAAMQHPGGRKQHARAGAVHHGTLPLLQAAEPKGVPLGVAVLHLLAGPADQQLVVQVCLGCHARREVYGDVEVHALPVLVEKDAQLLGAAQGEHGDEDLATLVDSLMDLSQEVALPGPLGVPDGGGIRCLRDEEVGTEAVDVCGPKVPVWGHVVVP
mmetsp:Transcript_5020/g.14046  ORF Transcript_5020/g.14046 Transcript_5020/m.14046 type:complete len:241 (-) Transcript_5020:16-738(-)